MKNSFTGWAFLSACVFSSNVFATGIPIPLLTSKIASPINISESQRYSCAADGNALQKDNSGSLTPVAFDGINITCHDNHLWLDGKALNEMDLLTLTVESVLAQSVSKN